MPNKNFLKNTLLAIFLVSTSTYCFAVNVSASKINVESQIVANANDHCKGDERSLECVPEYHYQYIDVNNYIMNPYNGMPSGGGTQVVLESGILGQSKLDQLMHNGTYNVVGLASMVNLQGSNNYAYGTNIFAQTGHVNGFAVGGMLEVINPFLQPGSRYLDGKISYAALPNSQVVSPSELYLEYQIPDKFQLNVGRIFIGDVPWMNSYDDSMIVSADFQGALANYQISKDWRLSAVATNAYQEFSSNSFNHDTQYNKQYNGDGWPLGANVPSANAYALGGIYKPAEDYTLNLWGYNFEGYANMLYADTNYKIHLADKHSLNLGVQAGNQNTLGMSTNVMQQAGFGTPSSYLAGAKIGYDYSYWLQTELSFDGMYGPDNAFYQGGFVSPYTYGIVNDPLYTSGLAGGLIEQGAGNSWRVATTFKPLYDDLKFELAYEKFVTASPMDSYDLDVKYKPFHNSMKGLVLHLWVNYTSGPATNVTNPGYFTFIQTMASYSY